MKKIEKKMAVCYNESGDKKMLENNKKLSALCILDILKEFSDENHPMTQADIIKKLYTRFGMVLERKSVGSNIESLCEFGYDIEKTKDGCYLASRDFEPSEISFLIDAVFSSRSIDSQNSQRLAKKLSDFLSQYQRKKYKYVCKADQIIRTNNKELFYTIDILNEAIEKKKQVKFNYNRFYAGKEDAKKQEEKVYVVNPYFMINNQGRYYLVCNYDRFNDIANYKIDLIKNIEMLDTPAKPITSLNNCENGIDMAKYANENIYMFNNNTVKARLKITNNYSAEFVKEWFGNNARFDYKGDELFADVYSNEQAIIYWCLQYGDTIELVEPEETRKKIADISKQIYEKYNK